MSAFERTLNYHLVSYRKCRISRHIMKAIRIFLLCPGLGPQVGGHLDLVPSRDENQNRFVLVSWPCRHGQRGTAVEVRVNKQVYSLASWTDAPSSVSIARDYWFAKTAHSITTDARACRYDRHKVNSARPTRYWPSRDRRCPSVTEHLPSPVYLPGHYHRGHFPPS